MKIQKIKGFTLVEMSIVLVIIGLILGAILGAQSMTRNAEVRATISEFNGIKSAISAFKMQYNGYPGDIRNATSIWPGNVTADGNGNGQIGDALNAATIPNWWKAEPMYAIQQLGLANMLNFTPSGNFPTPGSALNLPTQMQPGINVPASKLKGSGYFFYYAPASFYTSNGQGHAIRLAGESTNNHLSAHTLIPVFTKDIDTKMDDGIPVTGVVVVTAVNTDCVTPQTTLVGAVPPRTTAYNPTRTERLCSLLYYFEQ